ncbi:MAG: 2TM domain-containing protein [Winogradskyella sp.]|uniref:2TM domain-containing protein n=1 Tax=Winogradskyella sp. TaxID=1883156 RepID=UPI0017BF6C37|nr:2TM domain-containing protein [Winogradskyella sp.]MBT8243778.1 2TM domain-containing protein [Winogradskyella sp.]NNK22030.1 2TM domain-containing protein [Winogradskyella sp.]
MNDKDNKALLYLEAQRKVSRLRWFYVHLAGYLVILGLIIWNLLIIEDTAYTNFILVINYSTIFIWGFFIVFHALRIFKGHIFFSEKWEEKKMKEFMGDNHINWE